MATSRRATAWMAGWWPAVAGSVAAFLLVLILLYVYKARLLEAVTE